MNKKGASEGRETLNTHLGETHEHHGSLAGKMRWAFLVTVAILAVEVVGGILSNSLALLSDAGHVLSDVLALFLSWIAVMQAERPASLRMTWGYQRMGVLVAVFNAFSILFIAAYILFEAYQRFRSPQPVEAGLMLSAAMFGLLVNLWVVLLLRREQAESINIRSAFLHVLGDLLASVGVIAGGVIILLTRFYWVDPLISILIVLFIGASAWRIVKEGFSILMEATPAHLKLPEVAAVLKAMPRVRDVHDLHVWTVAPQMHVLSCHVATDACSDQERQSLVQHMNRVLLDRFHIEHSTIQLDCVACAPGDLLCSLTLEKEPRPHKH